MSKAKKTKADILEAAIATLAAKPAAVVTVEEVARKAQCAKGLVHYHFQTKDRLFAEAARAIWERRAEAWRKTLAADDPRRAIDESWQLLANESKKGVTKACTSLAVEAKSLTVQAVRESSHLFAAALASALESLFTRMRLAAGIPSAELGGLLAAAVAGFGHQLDAGLPTAELEASYAAFWAGLLSLTNPS